MTRKVKMKEDKLHHIKSTGFRTPDQYFESFENNLFEHLNKKKCIDGIETSGYAVPKDYFDSVEDHVFGKLNTENKPVIHLQSRKTFYYIAGIAASFVVLLSLFLNNNNSISIDSLETAALESYLNEEDYTSDDIASLFLSDDISETNFIDVSISDEMLNQYLESIETEDLILD